MHMGPIKMGSLGLYYIMYCRFGSFSETVVLVYIVVMRMLIPWFPGILLFLSGFGRDTREPRNEHPQFACSGSKESVIHILTAFVPSYGGET